MLVPGPYFAFVVAGTFIAFTETMPAYGSKIYCKAGTYLLKDKVTGHETCVKCTHGYYMEKTHHRKDHCILCDRPLPGKMKIVIQPCTSKSNLKMGCPSGHFRLRRGQGSFHCRKCRSCSVGEVEVRPCTDLKNTICDRSKSFTTHSVTKNIFAKTTKTLHFVDKTSMLPPHEISSQNTHIEEKSKNYTKSLSQEIIHECSHTKLYVVIGVLSVVLLVEFVIIVVLLVMRRKKRMYSFSKGIKIEVSDDEQVDEDEPLTPIESTKQTLDSVKLSIQMKAARKRSISYPEN